MPIIYTITCNIWDFCLLYIFFNCYLVFSTLKILALARKSRYWILLTREVEYLFICLLAIWISSFMECLLKSFAPFKIRFSLFSSWLVGDLYLDISPLLNIFYYDFLLPFFGLYFSSLDPVFQWIELLNFNMTCFMTFFFYGYFFFGPLKETLPTARSRRCSLFPLKSFSASFTFRYAIYLVLIFSPIVWWGQCIFHTSIRLSQNCSLKTSFFPHCAAMLLFS